MTLSSSHTHSPRTFPSPHRLISPNNPRPPSPEWISLQLQTRGCNFISMLILHGHLKLSKTRVQLTVRTSPSLIRSLCPPAPPLSPTHTLGFSPRAPSCSTQLPTAACRLTRSIAHREAKVISALGSKKPREPWPWNQKKKVQALAVCFLTLPPRGPPRASTSADGDDNTPASCCGVLVRIK